MTPPSSEPAETTLQVVHGDTRNPTAANALARALAKAGAAGTIYLGYPVVATADERVPVDALLVSRNYGVVAFLIADAPPQDAAEWRDAIGLQDRLYGVLESYLGKYDSLREGRRLALDLKTATVFSAAPDTAPDELETSGGQYGDLDAVESWVATLDGLEPAIEQAAQAAFQRVTTIKPVKRRASVERPTSRGSKLKEIEKEIANLDHWQKAAAIETPDGPQRIRGLAGSGKTVVLALKAAYLHTQHPDWNIAFTFHSRALYQQIQDLVTRFTFEFSNDRPDPDKLRILPSWGSRRGPGVYSAIAESLGEVPRDWVYARGKYGMDDAFQGICRELLPLARDVSGPELFDVVLVDEAQDLPPEFFQLVYVVTSQPKRIVWAFDELQRLSEQAMPSTRELFGTDDAGASLVTLESQADGPRRDIVLPICYRNTPWALATAHALGIGVYREDGLLQHPDEPSLWQDIGYDVVHGSLSEGSRVTLKRGERSYPAYFPDLLESADSVVMRAFGNQAEQDAWVAAEIATNISSDELEPDDILVVLPDAYTAKTRGPQLMRALLRHEISAHLVGVTSSRDEFTLSDSVAIAQIFRAKGNEAPMVYVVDSHRATQQYNEVTKRNALFTAITRSRAWVRIVGWGDAMPQLESEIERVIAEEFQLEFTVPTAEQLSRLRHIHRERPQEHEATVRKAAAGLSAFLSAVETGDLDLEDLPVDLRTRLQLMKEGEPGDDE